MEYALELKNITKTFGNSVIANNNVSLSLKKGEILALLGENGSGKTTSIAKIANKLVLEGKRVILAAADTFRAGAVEQLKIWAERLNVDIVLPDKEGADPASVVYKAFEKTKNKLQ